MRDGDGVENDLRDCLYLETVLAAAFACDMGGVDSEGTRNAGEHVLESNIGFMNNYADRIGYVNNSDDLSDILGGDPA